MVLIGPLDVAYLQSSIEQKVDSLMNHASINSIVDAESMTVTALILVGVLAKAIRNLSKRLSKSRLILETDSLTLNWQTQRPLSPQELQPQEQQGDDEDGRSDDDDGRIPATEMPMMSPAVAETPKKKRSTAYQRRYKANFKKVSKRFKLKSGKWKKNGFRSAVKLAHKMSRK